MISMKAAARHERKLKVLVSHATATSAESLPAYVTWDEWAIVWDMVLTAE